jgi:WD40 repeat protein/serine/threonine protein kinase
MSTEFKDLSGQTVKGYELRELIGRGGFGAVYRAYQPLVERDVAIKIILPEYANHPNFVRRFESEAQFIAQLEHIHIVPLYDYWREPDTACLVMRWLRGGSLQDAIDQRGAWDVHATARMLDQLASALTAAHRKGIIHRDLKPANVLLDEEDNAYLADFGIAKNLITDPENNSEEDRFGSPAYISPEQVTGQPVSPQTDIYSLGVLLYMVLTGRTPFLDPSTTTVIRRHLSEPLPPLQTNRPELPHALNMVIWRATSKRPEARYPDALSLAGDFRRIVSPDSGAASPPITQASAGPKIAISPVGRTLPVDLPLEPENPYKGLRAFQESDAHDFFGRNALVDRLLKRLSEQDANNHFLAVIGPSGSGKSSAVKAGLLPVLRRGGNPGSLDWFISQMTPGAEPFVELEAALLRVAVNPPATLLAELRADECGLSDVVDRLLPVEDGDLLLVIDQFEEVFTLVADESDRALFLKSVLYAVTNPKSRVRVIITLRADFYDRPLLYPEFGDLLRQRTEVVLPLTATEMEQAITGPAERMGLRFESGLVATIVGDVGQQPGGLPLLQFALTELFERREGFNLTRSAYAASSGVLGALARRADEVYEQLDNLGQELARQLFLRLVALGEGTEDTRRRILQAEMLTATGIDKRALQNIIDKFLKYRLLTADYEPITRAATIEIAHEALIRVWSRLKTWLDTNRDNLRLYQRLTIATAEWLNTGRDASYLASGARLAQFETLAAGTTLALTPEEAEYLAASIAARKRANNRLRAFVAGLAAFSIIAVIFAWIALDRQQVADTQARLSRSRELAVTALTGVRQTDLALLLSLEALKSADTFEARNSLLTALQSQPRIERYLQGHTGGVRSLAVSPDGRRLVSGSADHTLIIWDVATDQPIGTPLTGHTGWVNSIAFSPDGKRIASASTDQTIRIWNAETGEAEGEPLIGHTGSVWSVAFSPDGQTLASGSDDITVILWDVATGKPIGDPLTGHEGTVYSVTFSPDGKTLASGSDDDTIRLWDTSTWKPIGDPLSTVNWVLSLAFNPKTGLLASTGADRNVTFWDTSTGERLTVLTTNHQNWGRQVVFSTDGQYFATASQDHTVRIWDATSGDPVGDPFGGHSADVWSAAFVPGSDTIISADSDGKIIEWNITKPQSLATVLADSQDGLLTVAYSPDGKILAAAGGNTAENSGSGDNNIRLWDTATAAIKTVLAGHQRYITTLAFSLDGKQLASASADQTIRLWNVDTGAVIQTFDLPQRTDWVALAYSPDGKSLASGSDQGNIFLWDIASGKIIGEPLKGHTAGIQSLAFSPDGRLLASGSDDSRVILWEIAKHAMFHNPLTGHTDTVTSVAFSPDSKKVAGGSYDETIIVWDVDSGQPVGQPFVGQADYVTSVAFSPDGQLLASGGWDEHLLLWDVNRGEHIGPPFIGHTARITSVAFSPDGQTIATGSLDTIAILWDIDLESWENRACSIANRNLTASEWERYFQTTPYHTTCPISPS